ncbi:MAG: ATP-dependent helicase/nuclease subunit [Thermoanaerobaculia bacterium]|nr:ATP-dependent helicase/nuclease subunit [Thermoanaerobaculia bacterium]
MSSVPVQASFAFERPRRRNIVIEAGAGTGKTTAIVAEVLRLLLGDESLLPERIVLVTFTEKAAGEIADRIHEALTELDLRFDRGDAIAWPIGSATPLFTVSQADREAARRACTAQLARIDSLRSQTIHAFCQSLLRQFPIEAGLDPQFTIVEGFERSLLSGEVYDAWIDDETRLHPTDEARYDWEVLLEHAGYLFLIRNIILPLIDRRDLLLDETYDPGALELVEHELLIAIERLRVCDAGSVSGICDYLRGNPSPPRGSSIDTWLDYLNPIANAIRTNDLPRGKKGDDFKDAIRVLRAGKDKGNSVYDRLSGHRAALALLRMTRRFLTFLEEEKRKRGVVDFDDLLLRTLAVLQDDSVAERVRGQFDYIFVDEFQDTDRIQAQIIDRLARDRSGAFVEGKTVVVGDPKQSIYGFRRADPETYDAFTREMITAGAEARIITDQYRSDPPLLDAVNAIFAELFADAGFDPNVFRPAYHRLRAAKGGGEWGVGSGRETTTQLPDGNTAESQGPATASFSHPLTLTILDSQFIDRADRFAAEAESIAAWIKSRGDDLRRYALLFRRTTKLDDYLDVFDRRGIAYALPPTRLFLDRPAPVDLLAVLRAIAFPFDRGAEVSAARTPYFALTDDEIMRGIPSNPPAHDALQSSAFSPSLSRWGEEPALSERSEPKGGRRPDEGPGSLAEGPDSGLLEQPPHPPSAPSPPLKGAGEKGARLEGDVKASTFASGDGADQHDPYAQFLITLNSFRDAAHHVTVAQLIDLVIRTCGIEAVYAEAADGIRSMRHLEHLRTLAFGYDQRTGGSVRQFVDEITHRRGGEPDEMEPSLVDEASNAIRILTVHTAKGLEFDTVILPDLEFPVKSAELFLVENPRSLVLRGQVETLSSHYGRAGSTPLKDIGSLRDEAETRRLFYVAVTRAKSEVAFVTNAKPRKEGFVKYVDQLFDLASAPWPAEPGRVERMVAIGGEAVPVAYERVATEGGGVRTRRRLVDAQREAELAALPVVPPSLPAPAPSAEILDGAEVVIRRSSAQKRAAGILLHRILELWDGKTIVEPLLLAAAAEQGVDESIIKLVRRRLARVTKSKTFRRIAAAETLGRELPIIIEQNGTAVERRIDRYLREGDSDLVVDYKSGEPSAWRLQADREQVSRYCAAMSAITGRPCKGLLWYIDVDIEREVEV